MTARSIRPRVVGWTVVSACVLGVVAAWLAKYAIATPASYRTVWFAGPLFLEWGPIGNRGSLGVDTASGVAVALVAGGLASLASLGLAERIAGLAGHWRRRWISSGVGLAASSFGVFAALLLSGATPSESAVGLISVLGVVLMPGVWVVTGFGHHRFGAITYFGGITLNVMIWSMLGYLVLRVRSARVA
jgi:hypothetical protein